MSKANSWTMEENNVSTPVNKQRFLGMKRSIKKDKVSKTPLSLARVNYTRSLPASCSCTPATPLLDSTNDNTKSRTCLPYKLSLNKRVKQRYRKKKLEFVECLEDNSGSDQIPQPPLLNSEDHLSEEELELLVREKTRLLHCLKEHEKKVNDLQQTITKWKTAFNSALEDLRSNHGVPSQTTELLEALKIPPDMMKYITDY